MHARLDGGRVELLTRTGLDWSHRYRFMIEALLKLPVKTAYVVTASSARCVCRGVPAFCRFQAAMDEGRTDDPVVFAFDLLYLHGRSTAALPLIERKDRLRPLGLVQPFLARGRFVAEACELRLNPLWLTVR